MTEHVARDGDLLIPYVLADGDAHFFLEELAQVAGVEVHCISYVLDCKLAAYVRSDVVDGSDNVARHGGGLKTVLHPLAVIQSHLLADGGDLFAGRKLVDDLDVDVT